MRPPTDRELASDMPHVVLTSDTDWDTTVLDHSIKDIYQWAQNRHIDGPEESERPFDNLGILKVTKTITNSNSDNSDPFETILDYFLILLMMIVRIRLGMSVIWHQEYPWSGLPWSIA